jgi:hypothetical protein
MKGKTQPASFVVVSWASGRFLTVPRDQVFGEPLSPVGYVHLALALLLGGIVVVATIAFLILHDLI